MGQLQPDLGEVRSLPGGVQAFGRTDSSGVGIPCLEFMPPAQRDDTLGQVRIEVCEEKEVPAVSCLVDIAQGGPRCESDIKIRPRRIQRPAQSAGTQCSQPDRAAAPVIASRHKRVACGGNCPPEHGVDGTLHILVVAELGGLGRKLPSGDDAAAPFIKSLNLLKAAPVHRFVPWQDHDGESAGMNPVGQHQPPSLDLAFRVQDFGMQERVVAPEIDGQQFAHVHIVSLRHGHSTLVSLQRSVQMMAALQGGDGIEDGDVGHVGGLVLQQHV